MLYYFLRESLLSLHVIPHLYSSLSSLSVVLLSLSLCSSLSVSISLYLSVSLFLSVGLSAPSLSLSLSLSLSRSSSLCLCISLCISLSLCIYLYASYIDVHIQYCRVSLDLDKMMYNCFSAAAGTAHGYGVFDYAQKKEVFTKCTLSPQGN